MEEMNIDTQELKEPIPMEPVTLSRQKEKTKVKTVTTVSDREVTNCLRKNHC